MIPDDDVAQLTGGISDPKLADLIVVVADMVEKFDQIDSSDPLDGLVAALAGNTGRTIILLAAALDLGMTREQARGIVADSGQAAARLRAAMEGLN